MEDAYRLDCENEAADCRFIIQSEDEEQAIELAQKHMKEYHDQEYTEEEARNRHLEVV